MSVPNIGNLIVHAAGRVSATGVLTAGQNVLTTARLGLGSYRITLATPISPLHRQTFFTMSTPGVVGGESFAGETDTIIDMLIFLNTGQPALNDTAFRFAVFRYTFAQ